MSGYAHRPGPAREASEENEGWSEEDVVEYEGWSERGDGEQVRRAERVMRAGWGEESEWGERGGRGPANVLQG